MSSNYHTTKALTLSPANHERNMLLPVRPVQASLQTGHTALTLLCRHVADRHSQSPPTTVPLVNEVQEPLPRTRTQGEDSMCISPQPLVSFTTSLWPSCRAASQPDESSRRRCTHHTPLGNKPFILCQRLTLLPGSVQPQQSAKINIASPSL